MDNEVYEALETEERSVSVAPDLPPRSQASGVQQIKENISYALQDRQDA